MIMFILYYGVEATADESVSIHDDALSCRVKWDELVARIVFTAASTPIISLGCWVH